MRNEDDKKLEQWRGRYSHAESFLRRGCRHARMPNSMNVAPTWDVGNESSQQVCPMVLASLVCASALAWKRVRSPLPQPNRVRHQLVCSCSSHNFFVTQVMVLQKLLNMHGGSEKRKQVS